MPKAANKEAEAPAPASRSKKNGVSHTGASQVKTVERRTAANAVAGTKVKPNRRSEETITNILNATEEVVLMSGADRISILDVCKVAGVSRGTFYRYFASQEDLLDTFSRHKRESFHSSLSQELGHISDPDARLNALFAYLDNYLEQSRARLLGRL